MIVPHKALEELDEIHALIKPCGALISRECILTAGIGNAEFA